MEHCHTLPRMAISTGSIQDQINNQGRFQDQQFIGAENLESFLARQDTFHCFVHFNTTPHSPAALFSTFQGPQMWCKCSAVKTNLGQTLVLHRIVLLAEVFREFWLKHIITIIKILIPVLFQTFFLPDMKEKFIKLACFADLVEKL